MDDSGLIPHCYRLLGSVTEAAEVARSASSLEAATLACVDRAGTRPLPTDLVPASDHPDGRLSQRSEVLWLEPIPDNLTDGRPIDLALIAALQRLPPRDRAATVLQTIEGWSNPHITNLLGPLNLTSARTPPAITPRPGAPRPGRPSAPAPPAGAPRPRAWPGVPSPAAVELLLSRYRAAFEQYDVPAIVTLLADDAVWEMPPFTSWFRGNHTIGRLISTHCPARGPGDQYLVPLRANGQPAFAVYMKDPTDNLHRAFQIQVLTLTATAIVHAVAFFDLTLFQTFHLPDLLTGLPPTPYDDTPRPHVERQPRH